MSLEVDSVCDKETTLNVNPFAMQIPSFDRDIIYIEDIVSVSK